MTKIFRYNDGTLYTLFDLFFVVKLRDFKAIRKIKCYQTYVLEMGETLERIQ